LRPETVIRYQGIAGRRKLAGLVPTRHPRGKPTRTRHRGHAQEVGEKHVGKNCTTRLARMLPRARVPSAARDGPDTSRGRGKTAVRRIGRLDAASPPTAWLTMPDW